MLQAADDAMTRLLEVKPELAKRPASKTFKMNHHER